MMLTRIFFPISGRTAHDQKHRPQENIVCFTYSPLNVNIVSQAKNKHLSRDEVLIPNCYGNSYDNLVFLFKCLKYMYMYMHDHKPLAPNSPNPHKAISATLIYPAVAQPGKL